MTALVHVSDVPATLAQQQELAVVLAKSDLLPKHLYGKPSAVLSTMYAAKAYGIPLWTAFQVLHVIEGKVGLTADFMRSCVLEAGHTFRIVEATPTKATAVGIRGDDPDRFVHTASFTIEEANLAGLTGKANWKKSPTDMLVARATTRLMRFAFSDSMYGTAYTPEELGADVDDEGRVVVEDTVAQQVPPTPGPPAEVLDAEVIEATLDDIIGEHEVPAA